MTNNKLKTIIIFIITIFLFFQSPCGAVTDTDGMSGLIYGTDYSFWIDSPKGWLLDSKTAKDYGVNVVLYPEGFSFRNAPAVMYATILRKNVDIDEAMKEEAATYKDKYEDIKISKRPNITTKDDKTAHVQYYKGNRKDQTDEAAAFIQENGFYVLIVLSARSENNFKNAYAAYEQLVKSYALSGIKVERDTKANRR